jgi:hypothetical protein
VFYDRSKKVSPEQAMELLHEEVKNCPLTYDTNDLLTTDQIKSLFSRWNQELSSQVLKKVRREDDGDEEDDDDVLCPICQTASTYDTWVMCDACQLWIHIRCGGYNGKNKKYKCPDCSSH